MVYLGLLIIAIISIYYYWQTLPEISRTRRYLLAALRIIALALIIILLFNPVLRYTRRQLQKPRAILLIDNSISMQETADEITKYDLFAAAAQSMAEELAAKGYDPEIINFADGIEGKPEATRLAKSLADLQADDRLRDIKDIFLFSDGWFDDDDPNFIQNLPFAVHVFQADFAASGFDLEISRLKYNQRAWLKEDNPFIIDIKADNYSGKAELDFFAGDQLVQTRNLDFAEENYQQILFEHEFTATGMQKINFSVRTDSLNELQTENNSYPGAVLVLEDKAQVNIISDRYSWEGRFLVQVANQEQRFNVQYLLKERNLKLEREDVQLGAHLENCQVLCLINYGSLRFDDHEIELIERYVSNGGGLIYMGRPAGILEHLLPVRASNINRSFEGNFRLSSLSSRYQSFEVMKQNISEIPPVKFFYTQPKLSGSVLAIFPVEQEPPAIVFQEYGKGKVLYFSFLELWKWQLWGDGDHYRQFANNILQWLSYAKSENFVAYSEQNSYLLGDEIKIILSAFDEKYAPLTDIKPEITITKSEVEKQRDYLTRKNERYEYSFIAGETGEYDFFITEQEHDLQTNGSFIISSGSAEVRDRGINASLLNFLAKQTSGSIYRNHSDIKEYPEATAFVQTRYHEIPLYKKWYFITLFLIAFCLEIYFRKRWGLL